MNSSTTSTTVVKNLPDYAQPFAQNMLIRASDLSNNMPVAYSGVTFAAQNSNETGAIAALAIRGRNGNITITKGIALIEDILNGIYLNGTDAFFQAALVLFHDNMANATTNNVIPLVGGSKFAMGDLEGANLAQKLCSGTVAKYSSRGQTRLTMENYRAARTDQHQALESGIEFAAQSIRDAETLRGAGFYDREYRQSADTDAFNKWVDTQEARIKKNEILGNAIRALVGTQITRTEPFYKPNQIVTIAGMAISAASLAYMGYSAFSSLATTAATIMEY